MKIPAIALWLPSDNRNFLYPLLVGEGFFEVGEGLGVRAAIGGMRTSFGIIGVAGRV
jgi:hypothetical protein